MPLQICSFVLSQNTNVILPKAKIKFENNKNTFFQNGDSLFIINEFNNQSNLLWERNFNSPLVFITKNNEYLYSFTAVNDTRNICPSGYRVLKINDLIDVIGSTDYSDIDNEKKLYFPKSSLLEDYSGCSEGEDGIYKVIKSDQMVGDGHTYNASNIIAISNESNLNAVGFYAFNKNKMIFFNMKETIGLPIRCIENLDYKFLFQKNIFSYRDIMPKSYDDLTNNIIKRVTNYKIIKQNESLNFSFELSFDNNGNNVSYIKSKQSENNFNLQNELFDIVKKWDKYPYYEEIKIRCKENITLNLQRFDDSKSKFEERTSVSALKNEFNDINLNLRDLQSALEKGFKYNFKTINYRIELNGYLQNEPSISMLNKVKGKGPVYSLLSIVPGLGMFEIKTKKIPGIKLWHISVPIGAIAIASKIYSNLYYSRFLSDIDGSNSRKNYTNANISQKVFVTSLGLYSIMSLVDFGITFTIGCKNKALQRKVNKKLRKLDSPLILN
jgi:hypothetical protein